MPVDVNRAFERTKGLLHETPVLESRSLSEVLSGRNDVCIHFKCENFQKTGSFKSRGALNAVKVAQENGVQGLITDSSGNFGQALAWAGKNSNLPVKVVMPKNSSPVKVNSTRAMLGPEKENLIFCENSMESRKSTARDLAKSNPGFSLVSSYDHEDVISGQGTCGLEILEKLPDVEAIVVPIGGGGLISGIATAVKERRPEILVIGAEPEEANDAYISKTTGQLTTNISFPKTCADGLRTNLGVLTWPIIRDKVDFIVTVTEEEIKEAQKLTMHHAKIVIEPSSATAVAALNAHKDQFFQKLNLRKLCVVLSGGNIDCSVVCT